MSIEPEVMSGGLGRLLERKGRWRKMNSILLWLSLSEL